MILIPLRAAAKQLGHSQRAVRQMWLMAGLQLHKLGDSNRIYIDQRDIDDVMAKAIWRTAEKK